MPQDKRLVHIVGSVDVQTGQGQFLYVNPTSQAAAATQPAAAGAATPAGKPPPASGFELVVQAANGQELQRFRPAILLPSDHEASKAGLIDQSIPYVKGMTRLVLLFNGNPVDTYEAGSPQPPGETESAQPRRVELGAAPPGHPDKRSMSLESLTQPEPGISYTVQVRPSGDKTWQTIAVGQQSPKAVIDRNQFPGAERATVRVLRTTGFEDRVIAEEEMDLRFKE